MSLNGQVIKVNLQNQVITATAPITLRDSATDYNEIDKLRDISISQRVDGSAIIYNAATDQYEVKPITAGLASLDGGTF